MLTEGWFYEFQMNGGKVVHFDSGWFHDIKLKYWGKLYMQKFDPVEVDFET